MAADGQLGIAVGRWIRPENVSDLLPFEISYVNVPHPLVS